METSTQRVCMLLLVVVVVAVECAPSYLAFPRMGRSKPGYLAFPRMGRTAPGYLAFPRMGRSSPGYLAFPRMGRSKAGYLAFPRMGRNSVKQSTETECCNEGMKTVFVMGDEGKEDALNVCSSSQCCASLREVVEQTSDDIVLSKCVPDEPTSQSSEEGSSEMLSNLKRMLQ